jgi:hypothetical protein
MLGLLSSLSPVQSALLVAVTVAAVAATTLYLQHRWNRFLGGIRRSRGLRSERFAERLLKRAGYRIVETQAPAQAHVLVDGTRKTTWLRADFIVARKGQQFLVEVKSGAKRSPTRDSTRRQLLEYAMVYDVDGILLIDAESHTIQEIAFDYDVE